MTSRLRRQSILRLCCTAAGPQLSFLKSQLFFKPIFTEKSCRGFPLCSFSYGLIYLIYAVARSMNMLSIFRPPMSLALKP